MADCVERALKASSDADTSGIAACIARDGVIVARGANTVLDTCKPTRHAEINAIEAAAAALDMSDLSGCALYSSLQPCEMCLAAIQFAGIRTIYFAACKANVAPKYFMFPGLDLADFAQAAKSKFSALGGYMEERVLALYADGQE